MLKQILLKSSIAFFVCAMMFDIAHAHNGAIAYAYPMPSVTIDADLSDWPAGLKKYPISFYQYGFKPESENDINGYFVIGYNVELQEVYVAVEMLDDSYIRNKENPKYWAHDMQVLYIDPQHKTEGTGVLALEVNEYFRKIVDQDVNWDPFILNASWDMVEVKAENNESKTVYEWKIKLDGYVQEGMTIGFDYVVFDKDSADGATNTIGWGPDEGVKHECSRCLGDVLLRPAKDQLGMVSGTVRSDKEGIMPGTVRFRSSKDPAVFISTVLDSTGVYKTSIPPGEYQLEIPSGLVEVDEEIYRVEGGKSVSIIATSNEDFKATETAEVYVMPRPELIPEKGILHSFDTDKEAQLNAFIEAYRTYYGIPGVSLALIKDGKLFYSKTYGYKNAFTREAVDKDTYFEAASITKPVFAYVVLRLAERGVIDLDKPLAEYLPFDDLEEYPEYKKMTGRHVLTHRTGLPNWGREMQFAPGEKFQYSGEGFEYLKRVVAHITEKDITEVVNEELKVPEGIRHMEFKKSEELVKNVATGHIDESPTVRFLPEEAGMAWSMHTEAEEFSKFALMLLERRGLEPDTFKEMMKIHSEYPEDWLASKKHKEGMGLGISLRNTDYGKVFGHGGNNGDFKCMFEVYEDLGMGYIIFTNSNTGDAFDEDLLALLIEGKKDHNESAGGKN